MVDFICSFLNDPNVILAVLAVIAVLFFKSIGFILGMFKTWVKKKSANTPKIYVEEWLYKNVYEKQIEPYYNITQSAFRYCMQHKLLERKDILEFKDRLNHCVNLKDYKHDNYKNDAHEIYSKLKSTCISPKQMQALGEYLMDYVKAYQVYQKVTQPKPVKVYGHLSVVK